MISRVLQNKLFSKNQDEISKENQDTYSNIDSDSMKENTVIWRKFRKNQDINTWTGLS